MKKILIGLFFLVLGFWNTGCIMSCNKNFFNEIRDNAPPVPSYVMEPPHYDVITVVVPPTTYRQGERQYRVYGRGYYR